MNHPPHHTVPATPSAQPAVQPAPVWLQRLSLFIIVVFCIYLGGLLLILPWWKEMWDHNPWLLSHPSAAALLHSGAVKGLISGLGLLDLWIGISELIQYRDYRG